MVPKVHRLGQHELGVQSLRRRWRLNLVHNAGNSLGFRVRVEGLGFRV